MYGSVNVCHVPGVRSVYASFHDIVPHQSNADELAAWSVVVQMCAFLARRVHGAATAGVVVPSGQTVAARDAVSCCRVKVSCIRTTEAR